MQFAFFSNPLFSNALSALLCFLYYFIFEYFGAVTLGKIVTQTMVVDQDGMKAGFIKIFLRSLLRFVPLDSISFLFGLENGLHDSLSFTKVIERI